MGCVLNGCDKVKNRYLKGFIPVLRTLLLVILAIVPARQVIAEDVLFISSAYVAGPWQITLDSEVAKVVGKRSKDMRLFREDISSISRRDDFDSEQWVAHLNRKYRDFNIQRAVFVGGHARRLLASQHASLLPSAVKYSVEDVSVTEFVANEAPKVLSAADQLSGNISLIQQLLPSTDQLILVSGYPRQLQDLELYRAAASGMKVELWGEGYTYEELTDKAATLGSNSVIVYIGVPADAKNEQKVVSDFLAELAKAASRPIFVTYATSIGKGAIGGFVAQPTRTGQVVAGLLTGEYSQSTPLIQPMIDYSVLESFDISEGLIPDDSVVINRPENLLESPEQLLRYGSVIVVVLLVLLVVLVARTLVLRANSLRAQQYANDLAEEKAKSEKLYGVVAHELRTPVSAIAMMSATSDAEFVKHKDDIITATDDLLLTISDMSLMVRPDDMRPVRYTTFNLEDINSTISVRIQPMVASAGIKFIETTPKGTSLENTSIKSDQYRIRVAVINLIRNACLHSRGKTVTLTTECNPTSVRWIVSDDGIGIEPSDVDALFVSGMRGNTKANGSGLGLSLSREWIREIGGDVAYLSDSEVGSRFVVEIPRETVPYDIDGELSDPAAKESSKNISKFKVLFAEDEKMLRLLGAKLISNVVGEVILAEDGSEAFELFDESFDLIMTDFFMPNVDGAELTARIRASGSQVPIIGVTAATIGDQMQVMLDAGANLVIPKPLTAKSFEEAVAKVLG